MKAIIEIPSEVNDELYSGVNDSYIRVIERSGGVPLLLPYVTDADIIKRFADLCDGFFFTGGADIDPARYGEEKSEACGEVRRFRDEHSPPPSLQRSQYLLSAAAHS